VNDHFDIGNHAKAVAYEKPYRSTSYADVITDMGISYRNWANRESVKADRRALSDPEHSMALFNMGIVETTQGQRRGSEDMGDVPEKQGFTPRCDIRPGETIERKLVRVTDGGAKQGMLARRRACQEPVQTS
jgi:hypothetical protein